MSLYAPKIVNSSALDPALDVQTPQRSMFGRVGAFAKSWTPGILKGARPDKPHRDSQNEHSHYAPGSEPTYTDVTIDKDGPYRTGEQILADTVNEENRKMLDAHSSDKLKIMAVPPKLTFGNDSFMDKIKANAVPIFIFFLIIVAGIIIYDTTRGRTIQGKIFNMLGTVKKSFSQSKRRRRSKSKKRRHR